MSRPVRTHHALIRILDPGGASAWLRDRSPGWLYYSWKWGSWAVRHWRVTLPVFLFLWVMSGVGWELATLLGVSVAAGLTAWVLWRRRAGGAAGGVAKGTVSDAKLRHTLKKQWPLASKSAGILSLEDREPLRLHRLAGNGHGTITATLKCGDAGVPVADVVKGAPRIADVVGCRELVVSPEGPGVASLAFHWKDPIGRLVTLADLAGLLPPLDSGQIAYGIRQDGSVATVNMTQSILIGGLTRHGKSNLVWAMLGCLLLMGIPVDLYVSDPKGGVELDQLEAWVGKERMSLLRVREYAKSAKDTVLMMERAEKAMHARQYEMKRDGVRKVVPSPENPLVVCILDETLPLTDLLKKGTDSALGRVAYTGAAAAYVVWANTQVAQIDAIGRFRDLIPQRICFATGGRAVTDAVLGDGAEALGAECSKINEPGVGFSHSEGDRRYKKFRSVFVTDAETRLIAEGKLPVEARNAVTEAQYRKAEDAASTASKSRKDRATSLYRIYYGPGHPGIEPGTLGYVGISFDAITRLKQHQADMREFLDGEIDIQVTQFPTRAEALAAEEKAIKEEHPLHNVVHNGGNRRRWRREKVSA